MHMIETAKKQDLGEAVVTKLQGGLGNILFQYVAGLTLAERLGCELFCAQDGGIMHQSGLELVGIHPSYIELSDDLLRRSRRKKDRRLGDHVKSLLHLWPLTPVSEPHFHYWSGFEDLSKGVLLSGYWQSPRYFSALQHRLHQIIKLEAILETCNQNFVETITRQKTVSVHIRRGDFTSSSAKAVHNIMEADYYDTARRMLEKTEEPDLYCIFSDAPDTAKEVLAHWDKTLFVDGNNQQQDLALMGSCAHNIIANSSFSWWAAMLNKNRNKKVYAPKKWFTPQALKTRSIENLFPEDWHVI